ncbi:TMV resistance protein N [Glycine soja]
MTMQPSSSSFGYGFTYDVLLSFRGEDTRYGFTGNLYKALYDKGIHTFIDEELQRGDKITSTLEKAIQESGIFIIVLSESYASSPFCLNEVAYILNFIKGNGQLVLPVFHNVDTSHVRHHTGSFEQKNNFINRIVELVSSKINRVPLHVVDYPVGLESPMLEVKSLLLDVASDDVILMVGIQGLGGVGKTTLAVAVYNSIADNFEALCYLENSRETSNKHGILHLQSNLLSETIGEKEIKLTSAQAKEVLLILDDVDKHEQLQAIVGRPDWFGPGSRVIITTQDKHLLACHDVKRTYEVKELNEEDALQLLSWKAFKSEEVDRCFEDVLNRAVTYALGLPLALEVIGSNLFGKSIKQWGSALNRYERIPNKEIQEILKVSYDALEKDEQSIFLDIVCCFKEYELAEVEDIIHAHLGNCMKHHIEVLVENSLIKISLDGKVILHDWIEDMGKEIVRKESSNEPGNRSRLWFPKDI